MATLTANVSATDEIFPISAPLASTTQYLLVDSELVEVVTPAIRASQRDNPTLRCYVRRNAAGTVASHTSGTTYQELTSEPLATGSGVVQQVRLAGPLVLAHDSSDGLSGAGSAQTVASVVDGELLLDVFYVIAEEWTGATGAEITVRIDGTTFTSSDLVGQSPSAGNALEAATNFSWEGIKPNIAVGDFLVDAYITFTDGPADAGEARVYAVIAAPA